jgi:hypothetical protein
VADDNFYRLFVSNDFNQVGEFNYAFDLRISMTHSEKNKISSEKPEVKKY